MYLIYASYESETVMNNPISITILISVLGSSALFGFIQYIINRRDTRSDKYSKILVELTNIRSDMTNIRGEMRKIEAVNARIRILDASDQIRMRVKHSEEYFNQINEDITLYNRYCQDNPTFRNNRAAHAIDNINRVYAEALRDNDFL